MISFLIGGAAPVNWIMLVLLLGFLLLMFLLRKKVHAFEWMMHGQAAVAAIAWALGITLVMGLVPQSRGGGVSWLSQMLTFWPFVLIWTWMMVISGLATLNRILLLAFVCLQMCWWGINYLPSAQGLSIHTYNVN